MNNKNIASDYNRLSTKLHVQKLNAHITEIKKNK